MMCTAVILAVLVCGLVSRANSIICLSCNGVVRPRDCQYVQECGRHEKCSLESYVTVLGDIRYNVGCMDGYQCAAAKRKRDILNATVLNEIKQKNEFGTVPDEQSDPHDLILCSKCCESELCNIKGCGEQGLPPDSGLLCYNCEQEVTPDKCNKIALCSRDSVCYLSTQHIGLDNIYKSYCIAKHICQTLGVIDIGAYQLVGRRGFGIPSRFQRGTTCSKCCSKNLCNSDNCTSIITSTQAATTLSPVDGNWSNWGLWSSCTATCGSSVTRSRSRACTNPAPTLGGASCVGTASDIETCNIGECPVDGQWSLWTTWGSCTETCGAGKSIRQRNCDNPRPSATGIYCIGNSHETRQCPGPNGPHVILRAHNFSKPLGVQVIINCLEHGSLLPQDSQVIWIIPRIVGYPVPDNFEQIRDGSLVIHNLRAENCGPYSCTVTTGCGSYDSSIFYVNSYELK